MSSAKKGENKFALCLHISKFDFDLFHRAKPVTEMERQRNRGALRTSGPANLPTSQPTNICNLLCISSLILLLLQQPPVLLILFISPEQIPEHTEGKIHAHHILMVLQVDP